MGTIRKTPQEEFKEIGLSVKLIKEEKGISLDMKSNLSQTDINLLTDILVHTKIEALAERDKNGCDTIDTYIEMLVFIIQNYREKLERTLKVLEEYNGDKAN